MDFFTLVGVNASIYFLIYVISLWIIDCDLQLAFTEKFGKKLTKMRGKVIWISEASTELGRMMALKAAKNYGKLILSSNTSSELEKIKSSCLKINPFMRNRDILIVSLNVEELNNPKRVFKKVLKHFGRLDILIINEDKWEGGNWEDTTEKTDRLLFEANLFGVLSLCRLAVKYFNSKQRGKLALTSSIAGLIGVPYSGSYSASKHALHGYFNSLRFEKIGENIQITLLCLGSNYLSREKFTKNEFLGPEGQRRKKMTAERCAHLCLTAIINNLDEAWVAVFPILPLTYAIKYFPNFTKTLLRYMKPKESLSVAEKSTILICEKVIESQRLPLFRRCINLIEGIFKRINYFKY